MMLGGGCGRELAHWIIHGRPEKDMYGYDIRYINAQHDLSTNPLRWNLKVLEAAAVIPGDGIITSE